MPQPNLRTAPIIAVPPPTSGAITAMLLALSREHQDRGEYHLAHGPDYMAARHFQAAEKASDLINALMELDDPAPVIVAIGNGRDRVFVGEAR